MHSSLQLNFITFSPQVTLLILGHEVYFMLSFILLDWHRLGIRLFVFSNQQDWKALSSLGVTRRRTSSSAISLR